MSRQRGGFVASHPDPEVSRPTGAVHQIDRVGAFTPKPVDVDSLGPGEVGFLTASIKSVADCRVGDTLTDDRRPADAPLPGFKPSVPVVFCGLFPVDAAQFEDLRDGKLFHGRIAYHRSQRQAKVCPT